ncbi:MAG: RHS repeat-associated core domain-containing protein, partial [Candidatus Omnitrophica bacterium]|nr:RHS repeat-associated core domain-containing protein [Candidatus Omnitrophota bacterium]
MTIAQYAYDGDGGRTTKTTAGQTTKFVGSLYEQDNARSTKSVFLGGTRVASLTNGAAMYYHADHLGGANVLTDGEGGVKEIIEYSPFGEYSRHDKYGTDEEIARFYFTGQRKDDETGLYYYGARYYDPDIGRFITPDTIIQSPGNPQTFNRYGYCGNNPVNYTDPTGHFFGFLVALVIKAVTAVATYVAANVAVIATGAIVGGAVGGVSAAVMGGNVWQGVGIGALGGAVFAGLSPGLGILGDGLARGATLGGAAGPLTAGAAIASNFGSAFLGGAAAGAAVGGAAGANVGDTALFGGITAGAFSLARDAASLMRSKMVQQSRLDPRNSSGKSAGFKGDNFKLGGGRYDPVHPNGNPSP